MPRMLRIASFNLESLGVGKEGELARRIAVLRPQLQRLNADILCLQEIDAERPSGGGPRVALALDRLIEGTPYDSYDRAVSKNRAGTGPGDRHNLALISRLPLRETSQLWHSLVPPVSYAPVTARPAAVAAPLEWDRPVQTASVGLEDGRTLHLFNLHLRAPRAAPVQGQRQDGCWLSIGGWAEGFFVASVKRAGQALETRLAVDRLLDADPDALVVVCGDLNADDREVPLRILRGDADATADLAGHTLVPVERAVPESGRYSVVHRGRRIMLDHILASRALMGCFRDVEIHNEALGDEASAPEGSPDTFHAPLVASFAFD